VKRILFVLLTVMALGLLLTSCSSVKENPEIDSDDSIFAQMLTYKTEYIGDSSAVGNLLNCLPVFDDEYVQKMFALQTQAEPYGLSIYYEATAKSGGAEPRETEKMALYAEHLFKCIDNLSYVEYAYRTTPSNGEPDDSEYIIFLTIER